MNWDPRSWGLVQILMSAVLILGLPFLGARVLPGRFGLVFFLLEIVALGLVARLLATGLRRWQRRALDRTVREAQR